MFDIDTHQAQSPTAVICENAALYGAKPERDEFDPRDVWDKSDALEAVGEAFRVLADNVGPDGTQLADERESMLWGFVNMLNAQVRRLDRSVDRLAPRIRDLQRAQDGTEINARELELTTHRAQNLGDRRDAFEKLRDTAADAYRDATGHTWRPRRGSHVSQTGKLTSAAIDARDFLRARKDRETQAHLPDGTLIAIAGGKNVSDIDAIFARLDKARAKYRDMVLVHGGGPRRGTHRRAMGRTPRRPPGGLQAGLERTRARRAVPAKRRPAQPAAEGSHRVPGQRHHRQPHRQGRQARHPGAALPRSLVRNDPAGRVALRRRGPLLFGRSRQPRRRDVAPNPAFCLACRQ